MAKECEHLRRRVLRAKRMTKVRRLARAAKGATTGGHYGCAAVDMVDQDNEVQDEEDERWERERAVAQRAEARRWAWRVRWNPGVWHRLADRLRARRPHFSADPGWMLLRRGRWTLWCYDNAGREDVTAAQCRHMLCQGWGAYWSRVLWGDEDGPEDTGYEYLGGGWRRGGTYDDQPDYVVERYERKDAAERRMVAAGLARRLFRLANGVKVTALCDWQRLADRLTARRPCFNTADTAWWVVVLPRGLEARYCYENAERDDRTAEDMASTYNEDYWDPYEDGSNNQQRAREGDDEDRRLACADVAHRCYMATSGVERFRRLARSLAVKAVVPYRPLALVCDYRVWETRYSRHVYGDLDNCWAIMKPHAEGRPFRDYEKKSTVARLLSDQSAEEVERELVPWMTHRLYARKTGFFVWLAGRVLEDGGGPGAGVV